MEPHPSETVKNERKHWISLLNNAQTDQLETARKNLSSPFEYTYITKPETGMIMIRARADGSKKRFNLGEATISKCVLEVNKKHLGVSWVLGSDKRHAELAALFDGLMQDPVYHEILKVSLFRELKKNQRQKDRAIATDAEETKVEFFTMKRGE